MTEKFVDKMTDVSETDCSIGKMCSNQDTRVLLMKLQKKKIVTKFRGKYKTKIISRIETKIHTRKNLGNAKCSQTKFIGYQSPHRIELF